MNTTYIHKIQYYETDKMGVVHHSNYIRFFEESRTDYLEKAGLGYDKIETLGLIVPVLSVACNFKKASTYGDILEIMPKLTAFNGIKFEFEYEITSSHKAVTHVTGKTSHCFLDANFKPTLIKKNFPEVYDYMINLLKRDQK